MIMIISINKKCVINIKCWSLSRVLLFATPWIVDCQAPLSMEFSRQEYWSGLPFPSLGDLPKGIEPRSPALQEDSLLSVTPVYIITVYICFICVLLKTTVPASLVADW